MLATVKEYVHLRGRIPKKDESKLEKSTFRGRIEKISPSQRGNTALGGKETPAQGRENSKR